MQTNKNITIKDVAEHAGVSTATVSHVINNTRHVDNSTRECVLDAMAKLDYHPNSLARSLRSGKTKTIGLIVPDASNLFFADISRKIENLGYKNGYSVILCNSDNDLAKQHNYVNTLIAKQVDGTIFISAGESNEDLEDLNNSGIPIVVADRNVPLNLADVVLLDNEKAGYEATKYLIDLGHKQIACISGPFNVSPSFLRVEGYKRALLENKIQVNESYLVLGDYQFNSGQKAMQQLLEVYPIPTAVFVLNDMMAIGAISSARRMGLKVPEDISIIGFDDIEIATAVNPALTTMAQPIEEIAELAINLLINKMQGHNEDLQNKEYILSAKLVIRESTQQLKK
jgi:LacI family transcriptional regulator